MHGDGDQIRNKQYVCIVELKCPVCGKIFVPAPEHVYHDGKKKVCSWHCQVESERRKEAERARGKKYRGVPMEPDRDKKIVKLAKEGISSTEIAMRYGLTKGRVQQIIRANRE